MERTNKDGSINTRLIGTVIQGFLKQPSKPGLQIQQKLLGMCTFQTKVVNIRNLNFGERNWIR
jgi:hypothetical protein